MEPDIEKPQKTFPELSSLPGLYIKLSSEEPYIVGTKMSLGFLFYTRLCISFCFVLFFWIKILNEVPKSILYQEVHGANWI